jgi:uncharacterized protein YbbC (DUF1343 family)
MKEHFLPGIDTLLSRHKDWLAGRRLGLVSHLAAVDSEGCLSAERLWRDRDLHLACLMGPEHGFFGRGGAGELCPHAKHPDWAIPVYSLYGDARKPTPAMLRRLDAIVFDLQDLGARCYTYVSTLRLVLEAAAEAGKEVIVADRPVPLPRVIDGPIAREDHMSFVALVRTPISYGMTPGETALWLKRDLGLDVRLRVAKMAGYGRDPGRGPSWPPWLPPSPAIVSWESAMCFPVTVFFEALGAVDHGRRTGLPFQTIGAPWIRGQEVAAFMTALRLPGVRFYAHRYDSRPREPTPRLVDGIRLAVTDPARFRPVLTAVCLIHGLQELYGRRRVWAKADTRPDFFDKLFGTAEVREALLDGEDGRTVASRWDRELARFRVSRRPCLLYEAGTS